LAEQSSLLDKFSAKLTILPDYNKYWIACSGGLDSCVLLHLVSRLQDRLAGKLAVLHVNHGISEHAGEWADFVSSMCRETGLDLILEEIRDSCPKGESLEAWARHKRYGLFEQRIDSNEVLFTAHHQDDQAETLLLQLLRGSGPRGLAAMPELKCFGQGWHARPLLDFSRQQLKDYGIENNLQWMEDHSNHAITQDRNYLRNMAIPVLGKRWLNMAETLSRAASHQAETLQLQEDLASIDLDMVVQDKGNMLNTDRLALLSMARQKNLIRYWLRKLHFTVPDTIKLGHIIKDVVLSRQDALPCVCWGGVETRRYRNLLYAMKPLASHDADIVVKWNMDQVCKLTEGELSATRGRGNGIKSDSCPDNMVEIRYRKGGEKIKPTGSQYHAALKKLLQKAAVLPWYRDRIPLLYINDQLAAVPGLCIAEEYSAADTEPSWQIGWSGADKVKTG